MSRGQDFWTQPPPPFWRAWRRPLLALGLFAAMALDLAGWYGHPGFVLPCTLFALLLVAADALSTRQTGRGRAGQTNRHASHDESLDHDGETQFMAPPPPPLPGMMAQFDQNQCCTDASPMLARWLNTDRELLTGRNLSQILGGPAAAALAPQMQAAMAGNPRRLRCLHEAADGGQRWLQIELLPRQDEYGERIGCDLLAMDVSDEQRALDDSLLELQRLRQLLDLEGAMRANEAPLQRAAAAPQEPANMPPATAATVAAAPASPALPMFHARVLLADDNSDDQAVTRNMLEALGCELASACNGAEALKLLSIEHFDLVLMGCQMPVKDGLTATREIRAREARHPLTRRLPVVALDGQVPEAAQDSPAFCGDAEQRQAAGMDDLLAKPFTRQQLAAALARWLPPQLVEGLPPVEASEAARPRPAQHNIEPIASPAAHGIAPDRAAAFLEALPALLQTLGQQLGQANPSALARAALDLRLACSAVGGTALAELCRRIENQANAGETAGLADLVDAAESLGQRLETVLLKDQPQTA